MDGFWEGYLTRLAKPTNSDSVRDLVSERKVGSDRGRHTKSRPEHSCRCVPTMCVCEVSMMVVTALLYIVDAFCRETCMLGKNSTVQLHPSKADETEATYQKPEIEFTAAESALCIQSNAGFAGL